MAGKNRKNRQRIYWRERGGERRAYGDFRDFADVGGGREALIAEGATKATTDPVIAEALVGSRLADLQERRRNKTLLGVERQTTLADFASHHLVQKKRAGRVGDQHLDATAQRLAAAIEFFGADRDVAFLTVQDVQRWATHLLEQPRATPARCRECRARAKHLTIRSLDASCGKCGARWKLRTLTGGSVRHYLNALSNLYRRAQSEGYVQPGYNPVGALMEKPTPGRTEARWLEVHDAALLLESARTYRPPLDKEAIPFPFPLVATFLLTGGRKSEVLGLEVEDVSFDRKTVTFRPNQWRGLKTRTSHRTVPLWPQLEEILREHLYGGDVPRVSGLLFPSTRVEGVGMIADERKMLDAIADRAGWRKGEIRSKMFRHTYCAARLQTLDRGQPVSPWTVAREMGHGGRSLVDRVYGHLGDVRHRSEQVEYRVEQHEEALGEQLVQLRAVGS
jgi:integrase